MASRPPRIGGNILFSTSLEKTMQQALFSLEANIRAGVANASAEAVRTSSSTFKAVNQAVTRSLQSRTEFRSAHERLAERAQVAVLDSYDERVEAEKVPSYRVGQNRLSGGKLKRALGRKGMFVGTFEGIAFANESILNQEAAHWARLNWGAGGRANLAPFIQPLNLAGRRVGELRLNPPTNKDLGPFKMPKGYWKGGNQFYPRGRKLVTPTKGIAGRRFLDAGVTAIADGLNETYQDLLFDILDKAKRDGRGAGKKITVDPAKLGFKL